MTILSAAAGCAHGVREGSSFALALKLERRCRLMRCPSIFRMLSYDGTRFPASYILSWIVVSALQVSQALSCFYFKHNMLEFAGIPEGRFTLPGSGNPDNNLELCARYASAFGMDAASVGTNSSANPEQSYLLLRCIA